jgi:CheY-like chemotaxis protein
MNPGLILYAEDDENDVFLMQHAFRRAGIENPLQIVTDGQSAIDYLDGRKEFENRNQFPFPKLVLLDLKLPVQSGLEVLKWIRTSPTCCTLPVIMITSSNQDSDIHRAYILGVNSYLVKPGKPDELLAMVNAVRDFWLNLNQASCS